MTGTPDFLVEIGTEELPPKALKGLMLAFAENLEQQLREHRLAFAELRAFASPRRLAVLVVELAQSQADRDIVSKGPPVSVAFDAAGQPTPAALAFAKKCGVSIEKIQRCTSDKGEWLTHRALEKGAASATLLPRCVSAALETLPIPRRMRWGESDVEFVRPVHWVVMLHGKTVVPGEVLGVVAGNSTRGHRFLAPGALRIKEPGTYLALLEKKGCVIADFAARRERIRESVASAAAACGGTAVGSDALYDEVAALNEWPVALTGHFDDAFLSLPREVIVATLTGHQRYFSVAGTDGELLPAFIAIANIESTDPDQVRRGNERVIHPRLADAAFFWAADRRESLEAWQPALQNTVYQQGLGSLFDKSVRVAALAERAAKDLAADTDTVARAAALAKCDLVSAMVGEFPALQGVMGGYYAGASGESGAVSAAISEQYRPRFAGDALPASRESCCLALADKLDSLCGIFALGKRARGNRDPFGLRRSALGIVRMIIECKLDLDLAALITTSVSLQGQGAEEETERAVYDFIVERMRAYCRDRDDISAEMFASVLDRRPVSLLDFDARVKAVSAFVALDSAASLATANKRIGNILRKANHSATTALDESLLRDEAEKTLHASLNAARDEVDPLLRERRYSDALARLAKLRDSIDTFFDEVMVMVEDEALRRNRLALLAELRAEFLRVADISCLSIGKG